MLTCKRFKHNVFVNKQISHWVSGHVPTFSCFICSGRGLSCDLNMLNLNSDLKHEETSYSKVKEGN